MRDFVFLELRECNRAIRMVEDKEQKETAHQLLADTVKHMCRLCDVAHKKGLLALEEALSDMSTFANNRYLNSIMLLIVDGIDPDLVEELSMARYFSLGLEGVDALQYLMVLYGTLAIQAGEPRGIIEQKLLFFLPEEAEEIYRKEASNRLGDGENVDISILEPLYEGEITAMPGDKCYSQMKAADDALRALDDNGIQRLLRDVTNFDLAVSLQGLSGEARRRIFTNLSDRLAVMIAEDMEFMGPVEVDESAYATAKIISILEQLIENKEIEKI